jgi:hypothetical protein
MKSLVRYAITKEIVDEEIYSGGYSSSKIELANLPNIGISNRSKVSAIDFSRMDFGDFGKL